MADLAQFTKDLEDLLNRYGMENGSNTPDFMLAEYLRKCLETWNATVMHREQWYGRVPRLVDTTGGAGDSPAEVVPLIDPRK